MRFASTDQHRHLQKTQINVWVSSSFKQLQQCVLHFRDLVFNESMSHAYSRDSACSKSFVFLKSYTEVAVNSTRCVKLVLWRPYGWGSRWCRRDHIDGLVQSYTVSLAEATNYRAQMLLQPLGCPYELQHHSQISNSASWKTLAWVGTIPTRHKNPAFRSWTALHARLYFLVAKLKVLRRWWLSTTCGTGPLCSVPTFQLRDST